MNWMSRPPVTEAEWRQLTVDEQIRLLPTRPSEGVIARRDDRAGSLSWAHAHYRFLTAAVCRLAGEANFLPVVRTVVVIDGEADGDHGYLAPDICRAVAPVLEQTPPWQLCDWSGLYRRAAGILGDDGNENRAAFLSELLVPSSPEGIAGLVREVSERLVGRAHAADAAKFFGGLRVALGETVGYPWRPGVRPEWQSETATTLAKGAWTDRAFDRLPVLADALQDAGCDDAGLLDHLRGPNTHTVGCWALVDVLLPPCPV